MSVRVPETRIDNTRRGRRLAIERFQDFLRAHKLKFTQEREDVLERFFRLDEHIEADELLMRMRQGESRVSRATIYRTLDLLVQAGLARKVRLGTDRYYYEHILGRRQHEHMICMQCGKVIEWFDPEIPRVVDKNLRQHGFVAARYSLQVFGQCSECVGNADEARQDSSARSRNRSRSQRI